MRLLSHRERGANPVPDVTFVFCIAAGVAVFFYVLGDKAGIAVQAAGAAGLVVVAVTALRVAQPVYPNDWGCLPLAALPFVMVLGAHYARVTAANFGMIPPSTDAIGVLGMLLPGLIACGLVKLLQRRE